MTSMPPPWDPDDAETAETRALPRVPREEETAETRVVREPAEPTRVQRRVVAREEGPPPPPPGRRSPWPWLLLGLALLLALLAALWWFSQDDEDEPAAATRSVPSVLRLQVDDARRLLLEQGFVVEVLRRATDEAPRGIVFRQRPQAGEELAEGGTVRISASLGPASATVPDVVGLSRAEAEQALREAGLRPRAQVVRSQEEEGTVVAQAPAAGSELDRGSAVRVNVSGGPGTVGVPEVVGSPVDEAVAALEDVGLRAERTEVESAEPEGTVVGQDPPAGTDAAVGSAVALEVSGGPGPQPVPDVVGLTEDEARGELELQGFRVRVVEEPAPDPAQAGTVLRQVPPPGREAPSRALVTIVLGV